MNYDRIIITKYIRLNVKIQTRDILSHAIITKFSNELDQVITQGLEHLAGLIQAFEKENESVIKTIGK